MYISAGGNVILKKKNIVGVFDIDNTSITARGRSFLKAAQKNGAIVNLAEDIPKSYIVYDEGGKISVYLSQLAPATIYRRLCQKLAVGEI